MSQRSSCGIVFGQEEDSMLKAVVLLRRKSGLTTEQFIDHYENRHVPLVREVLPSIGRYVRNYLELNSLSAARQEGDAPTPYFDVITELWFDDEAAYRAFMADQIGRASCRERVCQSV